VFAPLGIKVTITSPSPDVMQEAWIKVTDIAGFGSLVALPVAALAMLWTSGRPVFRLLAIGGVIGSLASLLLGLLQLM
jgi:hypothetical protein